MSKSVRVHIKGRVQGVFFRAWTVSQAHDRGLAGWVRNLRNGAVEACFSGAPDRVDAMLQACKSGPDMAHVTDITVHPDDAPLDEGFRQLPTA